MSIILSARGLAACEGSVQEGKALFGRACGLGSRCLRWQRLINSIGYSVNVGCNTRWMLPGRQGQVSAGAVLKRYVSNIGRDDVSWPISLQV